MKGLMGKKVGMTQLFDDAGRAVPVTVIKAGPCYVTQVRTVDHDGYSAVQLGFEETKPKRLSGGELGHLRRVELPPLRYIREFKVSNPEMEEGDQLTVEIFELGDRVDISGTTKGKGFAGGVKRHNFRMQDATHGNSLSHRAPGSIGQCQTPGRVFKGKRMAGHMGAAKRTMQNLEVIRVDADRNLLLVKGAVPGAKGGNVVVRPAVKAR